jgi:hypothetical protein
VKSDRSRRAVVLGLCSLALVAGAVIAPVDAMVPVATAASSAGHVASSYVAIPPTRLADTRPDSGINGHSAVAGRTIRVQVAGRAGVPIGATAAVVNITSVDAWAAGWVTAYPSGEALPGASSLNVDLPGRVISNLATVRLGADGAIAITSSSDMHLVVDVVGAYVPQSVAVAAGRLETLAGGAQRALDTRDQLAPFAPGETRTVDLSSVGLPAGASAAVVSLVATEAAVGYWTAFPTDRPVPLASSMNIDRAGQTRSAQAIVALAGGSRSIQVFSQSGGHLVVDVAGWFTGSTAKTSTEGLFVPSSPTRVLDTRDRFPIAPWGGTTLEFDTGSPFPAETGAVALNVTATDPWYLGYVTAYPAGVGRPGSSNLNVTALDQIVANHAIVRAGTRGLAVFTQSGSHLVADVAGWYLGRPAQSVLPEPRTEIPTATTAVTIKAPRARVDTAIGFHRNIDVNIDSGRAGLWMGTGRLATAEHNVYFAHRTTHGGPFRHIDQLTVGSTFEVIGADGRAYRYLVTRQDVIVPRPAELLKVIEAGGPITLTLVACHPPGSVRYRLAVTGRLIGIAP